tara:strand:+ start:521 stop:997 length:477 start_codon:yes stop_codon:yes gene_type:complete
MSCSSSKDIIKTSLCPNVFFSSDHKKYVSGESGALSIDNLSYKASINNYSFKGGCTVINETFDSELTILFIVKPINVKENNIKLPYYAAIINSNNELLEIQYYQIDGKFNVSSDNNIQETDLFAKINIKISENTDFALQDYSVVIGFMLDSEKLKILN